MNAPLRMPAVVDGIELSAFTVTRPCVGCGAATRYRDGAPGTRAVYHPAPVCSHMVSLMQTMGLAPPPAGLGIMFEDSRGALS